LVRNSDKVNAVAGVAALSGLIAAILIVSDLDAISSLLYTLADQLPSWTGRPEDILPQLSQVSLPLPDIIEGLNIYAIMGLLVLSVGLTTAAARMRRKQQTLHAF
jgi:hypothetical protein